VLQSLCDRLGFTTNLALLDGTSVVYVARIAPAGAFQGAVRVGSRLPAHATVLGRALLQDMDAGQLRELFGGSELPQFSESTPRSVDQLLQLLQQDHERGYAMGEGFYEPGVSSIAAPVRDAQGRIVAGLGMAVAFTEIAPGRMAEWVEQVRAAADELAGHLRTQHPGFLR
jgi:DNA-binding IclR family transcriptional regulator